MQPAPLPLPRSPGPVFSTHTARQQAAWNPGDHAVTGTTTERAALFGAFRLLPAQQFRPEGLPLRRMFHQRIPPLPDLDLPSHSTGAKP
jgi:hypothetical protein